MSVSEGAPPGRGPGEGGAGEGGAGEAATEPPEPSVEPGPERSAAVHIELRDFEGPLDLLLHLVKQHELDILDIPVAFITDRYLAYLNRMRALDLDVASEYLVMAATLAWLKSRELLPPSEEEKAAGQADDDDDGLDPRQELIRRLLEYQKYKEAAGRLGDRPVVGRNVWLRGSPAGMAAGVDDENDGAAPLAEVPVFKLIEAFEKVLSRSRVKLTHDVVVERISLSERINALVDRLEREGSFTFTSCFDFDEELGSLRHQLVITFLAILEMTRLKLIRVHQPAPEGEIYVSRGDGQMSGMTAGEVAAAAARADEEFQG